MVDIRLIPKTECLKDTVARVLPYWYDTIVPEIKVKIVTYNILLNHSQRREALRTSVV